MAVPGFQVWRSWSDFCLIGLDTSAQTRAFADACLGPSAYEYKVETVIDGLIKYEEVSSDVISPKTTSASIVPFAQKEMVVRFLEGLDPNAHLLIRKSLHQLAVLWPELVQKKLSITDAQKNDLVTETTAIVKDFIEKFKEHRQNVYVDPIMTVVGMMPKEELASMAESLVTLTSNKRRMSMELETVGGPVDVAIITKGEGFIWAKRKLPFKSKSE